jgi:hypothetical protein
MGAASAECPVCGTRISETRFAEIQEQIREEEQAKLAVHAEHLRIQHEAAMKVATAEAAREARQEAEQKLTQAQLMQTQQADRIATLEANEVALRTDAANEQEQLRTQFDKDLKAATDKATNDVRREVQQRLSDAQLKETLQADRIVKLEANEVALRADAANTQKQLSAQFERDLKAATDKATNDARREVQQKLSDAQLKETQQADRIAKLEANEATLRANASRAEEQLRIQFANDLKTATEKATNDARAAMVAELSAKDAEVRTLKDTHAQELKQQREALDEHRDLEIQKINNARTRDTEALQKKVQELSRKLEQKTAHELGDVPEIDLHRALCEAFHGDNIRRVKKGESGADIIHEVMHNGQHCQTIVYDSKNRRIFQTGFVQKLLVDKANAKAEHAVLVTSMFPSGQRDLCIVDGVIVAKLSQVVTVAAMLRDSIVTDHLRNLSFKDRTEKKERLYSLMTSEMFRQRMAAIERAVRELEKIDAKEMEDHRRVWTTRAVHYKTADKSVRDLVTEVNVILQNPGSGVAVEVAVRSVTPAATGTDAPFRSSF